MDKKDFKLYKNENPQPKEKVEFETSYFMNQVWDNIIFWSSIALLIGGTYYFVRFY